MVTYAAEKQCLPAIFISWMRKPQVWSCKARTSIYPFNYATNAIRFLIYFLSGCHRRLEKWNIYFIVRQGHVLKWQFHMLPKKKKKNHRCLKMMGSLWFSTNTWKLPKGKFPAFIKIPMSLFYSLAYGTVYKTLQPSRMPVVQFYIPGLGYFLFRIIYLHCKTLLTVLFRMISCLLWLERVVS